jgi:hypothetical protein
MFFLLITFHFWWHETGKLHICVATPVSYYHVKVKAYIEWQEVYILYYMSWILVSDSFLLFSAMDWIYGNELKIS